MIAAISVAISVLAFGFSLFAFLDGRRRDQRDIYIKVHQLLVDRKLERGRYLLLQKVIDEDSVGRLTDNEWGLINRAMAAFNTLGLLLAKGYVEERDVMDIWAPSICRAWKVAQPYIAYRERLQGYRPWKYFAFLAEKAQQHLSRKGDDIELKVWRRGKPAAPAPATPPSTLAVSATSPAPSTASSHVTYQSPPGEPRVGQGGVADGARETLSKGFIPPEAWIG